MGRGVRVEGWVGEDGASVCLDWRGERGDIVSGKVLKHSALTGRIIGCAMRVHSALGNGFQEVIYQRALEIEMTDEGLSFDRERSIPVFYKGHKIGARRVDFLVSEIIPVELKALGELERTHFAQGRNYLEAFDLEVGLLINFGAVSLQFRRVENDKFSGGDLPVGAGEDTFCAGEELSGGA